ncbi:MAG: diguanylate cyclase [Betaproteobacteria bacterium]|nr:diguanylate cyclase [Betaproteobacteria bacterium]
MSDVPHCRVLLVEDEASDANLVKRALRASPGMHYEVVWVTNLGQAKQQLQQGQHDVVLADLSLPDSAGLHTVQHLHQARSIVPLIVLTGNDDGGFALQALESGAQDYLVKGDFDNDSLTRAIRYAISRARLEQRLIQSEALLRTVTDYTYDWVYWINPQRQILYMSPSCERISGYSRSEFIAFPDLLERIVHPDDQALMQTHLLGEGKEFAEADFRIIRRDGEIRWIAHACNAVRGLDGEDQGRRVSNRDITERKRLEAELRELATTDTLTGLSNRRHFLARLEEELARVKRLDALHTAVLMLDLDFFKRVNDEYGHLTGDAVLVHFATLMREALRKIDTGGRVGGEEFAIILAGADQAAAQVFAERLRSKVASTPLRQHGTEILVTVSIGISVLDPADASADAVLMRADGALYHAKRSGRNRVETTP